MPLYLYISSIIFIVLVLRFTFLKNEDDVNYTLLTLIVSTVLGSLYIIEHVIYGEWVLDEVLVGYCIATSIYEVFLKHFVTMMEQRQAKRERLAKQQEQNNDDTGVR